MKASYDGYSACPIYVGENKLILAEFLYDGKVKFFIFYIIFFSPQKLFGAHKINQVIYYFY